MSTLTIPEIIDGPTGITAGIREWVSFEAFGPLIQASSQEVVDWIKAHGSEPAGPFYIRYFCISPTMMQMEVEIGIFGKPGLPTNDARVSVSEPPAGRYLTARFTGGYDGLMDATAMLVGFAKEKGIQWDSWDKPEGEEFAGRYELYLTDPADNPDPATWVTDVAIKVA